MHFEENLTLGVVFMLLSFFILAIMSALAKAAAPYASPLVLLFFQNGISFLLIIPLVLKKGIKETFATQRLPLHLLRAVTGTACWYCLFFSVQKLSLNTAVLLIYSAPLWMPVMGHLLFKEKSHPKVWLGVIVGFIGIAFVLHTHSLEIFKNSAVVLGLVGGVLLALAMFAIRWLNRTENPITILSYYFSFSTLMVAPFAISHFDIVTHQPIAWIYIIGIGLMLAFSQFFIVTALQYASAVKLSPFIYSVIVFSAIIDSFIWHNIPDPWQIFGMILVAAGGIFAMRANAGARPQVPWSHR
jgi:drug/metabolite transporter (DMT)-like permease